MRMAASTILLQTRLSRVKGLIDAVVCFSDRNNRHQLLSKEGRLKTNENLVKCGVGFGCMHYGVEVPKKEAGDQTRMFLFFLY